jgi:epoxyqueuosine reductase
MEIYDQLKTELKEYGAECRIVSASHIPDLEAEYNLSLANSQIDKQFLKKSIQDYIDFFVLNKYPAIRSLIIIATPSPQVEVELCHDGTTHCLIIPPHYSDRIKVTGNIKNITSQIFDSNGYRTFSLVLPKKLLAVRSGLAKYGKNNISYVSGMGSYHRLTTFASDLPCDEDSWQNLQLLERCSKCKACQNNCPTAAISADHFLIKAERCITYANEQLEPFPKWIDSRSHNSIIGCMRCQSVCPENKKYKSSLINKDKFSEAETGLILKGFPFEELPEKLQLKLNKLSLKRYYKHLSRNIKVLIENANIRKDKKIYHGKSQ